jgi:hypothetical protein
MGHIVQFKPNSKPSVHHGSVSGSGSNVDAEYSALVAATLQAQDVVRGGIMIAIYELELALYKCRKTIAGIPDGGSSVKQKLQERLGLIGRMMDEARLAARNL